MIFVGQKPAYVTTYPGSRLSSFLHPWVLLDPKSPLYPIMTAPVTRSDA